MTSKLTNVALSVCVIAAVVGCSATPTGVDEGETIASGSSSLVGGRDALDGEYPSTVEVQFHSACCLWTTTVVKVGPRHFLTGANGDPGTGQITMSHSATGTPYVVTIQEHKVYAEYEQCFPPCDASKFPDLTVFVVDRDTPDIPQATVDLSPVEMGSTVVKCGYGQQYWPTGPSRLTVATAKTMNAYSNPMDQARYVVAEAGGFHPQTGSTGNGDWGAPLYRDGPNQKLVAGVCANLTLGDANGAQESNFYERVDTNAGFRVASWLTSLGVNVTHSVPTPSPYKGQPVAIPGTIQAEDYDFGGPEIAYHDTTPQNFPSGTYRVDGVDIDQTGDQGGGYNVGGTQAGEWLRYSVMVTAAGTYDVDVRAAAVAAGKTLHVEIDGRDVTGPLAIANTGNWQQYQISSKANVRVEQGAHVVRLVFDTGDCNVNWVRIGPPLPTCTAAGWPHRLGQRHGRRHAVEHELDVHLFEIDILVLGNEVVASRHPARTASRASAQKFPSTTNPWFERSTRGTMATRGAPSLATASGTTQVFGEAKPKANSSAPVACPAVSMNMRGPVPRSSQGLGHSCRDAKMIGPASGKRR